MAEASEHLTHPILGTLGWLPDYSHWFTQLRLPSREWLGVIVEPGDTDRFEFLTRAGELFLWAFDNEQRVLADAMQQEFLLANQGVHRVQQHRNAELGRQFQGAGRIVGRCFSRLAYLHSHFGEVAAVVQAL
jgi:hypothetical protein